MYYSNCGGYYQPYPYNTGGGSWGIWIILIILFLLFFGNGFNRGPC